MHDRYQRHLSNQALKQRPCDLAARKSRELTVKHCFTVEEQLKTLDEVSLEDVQGEHERRSHVFILKGTCNEHCI